MDKFEPGLAVQEGVQSGHLGALKVSIEQPTVGFDLAGETRLVVDIRSEGCEQLYAALKARLEAGESVVLPADTFRSYRGPTPSEPVTLFLPANRSRHS